MEEVNVCKAALTGTKPTEPIAIIIDQELPQQENLEAIHNFATRQADMIEAALVDALPGATYDRLLMRMLERKASFYIVSHMKIMGG